MFSGIITGVGTVRRTEHRDGGLRLELAVPEPFRGLPPGASVAVNGVCLTVVGTPTGGLDFDAVGATLQRTLLGEIEPGDRVNLERSLELGGTLDGHFVTGHVDGVGTVAGRTPGEGAVYIDVRAPRALLPEIAPRGSVAVDGVSLTVAEVRDDTFRVSVVPFTLEETILGMYRPGRRVHLETDVLAKYVRRAAAFGVPAPDDVTMENPS